MALQDLTPNPARPDPEPDPNQFSVALGFINDFEVGNQEIRSCPDETT